MGNQPEPDNAIKGYFYLHTNSDLIYKPGSDSIIDIRESTFAVAAWPFIASSRTGAWSIIVEAEALGAKPSRIEELAQLWQCDNDDALNFAAAIGIDLQMDGDKWCAKFGNFQDLATSPAGFGDTARQAMSELCKEEKLNRGTGGWGMTIETLAASEANAA